MESTKIEKGRKMTTEETKQTAGGAQKTKAKQQKLTELWSQYGQSCARRERNMVLAENERQQAAQIYQQIMNLEK